MLIGIDASRASLRQATGTEYYSWCVINEILRQAPQHDYRLYARAALSAQFEPPHQRVQIAAPRLWTHIGLARELHQHPPQVLFVPAHTLPIATAIHPPRHNGKPIRTVVTIHDVGYRHFPQAHPLRQRLYLEFGTWLSARFASHLIVDSIATRNDVAKFYGVPLHKMTVVYPGHIPLVDITEDASHAAREKFGLAERPYALYVGTLQPRKNIGRLLAAWQQLQVQWVEHQPHMPSPILVLAGKLGWGGLDVAALAASLHVSQSVLATGYVSDAEKSALMRGALAFAFPSLYEGFGFPVLEAQSVGVPVACSHTSSLLEVAGDSAVGVDPLDVDDIARGLWQAMTHSPTRARVREAGLHNVQRFTWRACAWQISNVLTSAFNLN